ncbi:MAG: hypothetical protein JJU06_08285 [Ectothiorhodospiraceae bacterium]|nr:hypothetical protein [Ectothiorhodospiraceae bacterium]MCH8503576.1 hypothetical protein [Ectothiorhodospiraceae bacterium]
MPQSQDSGAGSYSVLIFLLALFLLVSPFALWWMGAMPPWYFPFLLWLGIILLTALLSRSLIRRHDP